MNTRTGSLLAPAIGLIALLTLLGGCAQQPQIVGLRTPTPAPTPVESREAPTPVSSDQGKVPRPAAAESEEPPLLRVSGTVSDDQGQSLDIVVTITDVAIPTEQDQRDFEAWCQPAEDWLFSSPDTRTVTLSVSVTSSGGFSGWSDERGIEVYGSAFQGSIWNAPPSTPGYCVPHSKVSRPGTGTVKVLASSDGWAVDAPVADSSAATLSTYGFRASSHDALGQPTGARLVSCVTEPSTEFTRLAAVASVRIPWTDAIFPHAHQCGHGRVATEF